MEAAYVSTWTRPVAGREVGHAEAIRESQEFWRRHAQDGRCQEPVFIIAENGEGMKIVVGEREAIEGIMRSDSYRQLQAKFVLTAERLRVGVWSTGDQLDVELRNLANAARELVPS